MTAPAFALVHGAAEEVRPSPSYRFDNSRRSTEHNCLVVQLTLAGQGFIRGPEGEHRVPADHAMLFTHREPTIYGYPPGERASYRLRFVSMSPAPELEAMFIRLRADFGRVVRVTRGSLPASLFAEAYGKARDHAFTDRFEEAELLYRLLLALYREQVQGSRASDPIGFGYHLLRDRFRQPLNLKDITEACAISREHFTRGFHARYGETPSTMLRRLRLEHGRRLLLTTELPVEDVAVASGFASSHSFGRAYRQAHGHPPSTERR